MTEREINLTASFSAMMNLDERRFAFLKETVLFYNSRNRATNWRNGCIYAATETSPGCAIGRFIPPDGKFDLQKVCGIEKAIRIGNQLPDWMMEMGIDFLADVQSLHDVADCWNDSGLSARGKEEVMDIIARFITNAPAYDAIIVDGTPLLK
jgi:hypothetical protein